MPDRCNNDIETRKVGIKNSCSFYLLQSTGGSKETISKLANNNERKIFQDVREEVKY